MKSNDSMISVEEFFKDDSLATVFPWDIISMCGMYCQMFDFRALSFILKKKSLP